MIFRKNLPGWERAMRVVLGAIMIGYGLVSLPAGPLGYAIAAGGAIAIITGFFGFCPMCAMAAASCRRHDRVDAAGSQRVFSRNFRE